MTRPCDEETAGLPTLTSLGEHAEAIARLEELLATAWIVTDADLLEAAWFRIGRALRCRDAPGDVLCVDEHRDDAALAGIPEELVEYVDQFVVEPGGLARLAPALERHLPKRAAVRFVSALNVLDGYSRACALLDVARGPSRRPLQPTAGPSVADTELPPLPATRDGEALRRYRTAILDPRLVSARAAFARASLGLNGLDELTTEAVRLRNAAVQECRY